MFYNHASVSSPGVLDIDKESFDTTRDDTKLKTTYKFKMTNGAGTGWSYFIVPGSGSTVVGAGLVPEVKYGMRTDNSAPASYKPGCKSYQASLYVPKDCPLTEFINDAETAVAKCIHDSGFKVPKDFVVVSRIRPAGVGEDGFLTMTLGQNSSVFNPALDRSGFQFVGSFKTQPLPKGARPLAVVYFVTSASVVAEDGAIPKLYVNFGIAKMWATPGRSVEERLEVASHQSSSMASLKQVLAMSKEDTLQLMSNAINALKGDDDDDDDEDGEQEDDDDGVIAVGDTPKKTPPKKRLLDSPLRPSQEDAHRQAKMRK